jgi:acyl transferase domain-containing protein/NADPH:quinone reductase-like Zn-dependent oxidoreductase/ubiquinone/menaquinone biosynthesis C-methylase UbiE
VNQDGKTETITTPSEEAQATLIRECYRKAGLDPSETTYFEAHGTGTPTGDPIEARAVAAIFKEAKSADKPLVIGSVKTNIGHTETASGLASIIKVAMSLEKGVIPPSINFEQPNPNIPFADFNLQVARQLQNWPDLEGIRRASVNNFGYGGSNAHVIMESYNSFKSTRKSLTNGVQVNGHSREPKSRVFTLSAKDETTAQAMISNLKDHLASLQVDDEEKYLDSLAYTLGQRRSKLPWVAVQPAQSLSGLIKALGSGKVAPARAIEQPKIGFVFTGQGAQWWAMGRELIEAYPLFKASVLEAEGYLRELGSTWNLIGKCPQRSRRFLYKTIADIQAEELTRSPETTRVNELAFSTPLCAVVQIGLVRLLESWGVKPTAVTSHSSGEVAAAYASGALSLRSAMAIVFARGQVAGRTIPGVVEAKGGMAATGLGAEALQQYISRVTSGKVVAACFNSPTSTTASGDVPAVVELEAMLKADNIFVRRLKIDAAYHSHHMQALGVPYLAWLQKLVKSEDRMHREVIYSSPTTGKRETSGELISGPQHWVNSFGNPVRFVEALRSMCFEDSDSKSSDVDIVIEIGPHAALSGPIQEIVAQPEFKGCKITYFPSLIRKSSAVDTMHSLASELMRMGYPINLNTVNFPFGRHEVDVLHDLPSYPWNHQMRHWSEPRFNKDHRHRVEADHDLLGSLVLGTNMITPSWRHVVRLSDLPWLRDHKVQTDIVYPGAGYICMAIEGSRQVAQTDSQKVLGYQLRDIEVLLALQIPDTADGVEVQLTLVPCSDKAIYAAGWKEFHVYSVSTDSRWTEHCRGLIQVDVAAANDEEAESVPPASAVTQLSQHGGDDHYRKSMNPADVYDAMHHVEIRHGPIFQNLKGIRTRNEQSVASFSIADTATTQPYGHQSEHVVDPTTLDSLFQAAYAGYIALPDANMAASFVPRIIKGLYVSSDINRKAGHNFKAYCDIVSASSKSFDADLVVVDDSDYSATKRPVLKVDHYVVQSLGNVLSSRPDEYEKLSVVKWAPDFSLLDTEYFEDKMSYALGSAETKVITDLRRLVLHYINDAVSAMTVADVGQLQWAHKKYYVWMKLQRKLAGENKLAPDSCAWFNDTPEGKARLYERVRSAGVSGEIVCRIGPAILPILRRELLPEELLLKGALSEKFRLQSLGRERSISQIEEIIELFVHQNPRTKIIEVGGGTGTTTEHVLNILQNDESGVGPLAASYDFTDISSELVEAAEDKFKGWNSLVKGKTLDVDRDPAGQDFENGTYDLVIASQVLTATKNIDRSLANVRKLLKPGGKLLLLETTRERLDLSFVFGLLPEWWTGEEEERAKGPFLSSETWDCLLKNNGFSGAETDLHDCEEDRFYSSSVILSTATGGLIPTYDSNVVIITDTAVPAESWTTELQGAIAGITGTRPTMEALDAAVYDGKICIYLDDFEQPILKDPTTSQFDAIKALCTRSKGLLWLTRGGAVDGQDVNASLSQGFLRTLRTEYAGKRAVLVDLDPEDGSWSGAAIHALTSVYKKTFDYSLNNVVKDFEYAVRDGVLQIPRFYKDAERNRSIFPNPAKQAVAKMEPFQQTGRRLRLNIGTPGLMDTLAFCEDLEVSGPLPEDYVEVEPRAFGVNFRDVMVAMGQLDEDKMGFECAGIVNRAGSAAAAEGFKEGDRITALMTGHYSNLVRVPWTNAAHIPDDLSFDVAASLPKAYSIAYISLYETARLQKGETVLIHAATGGVGQAAINLAKAAGAEIFVTAGTSEKRAFLTSKFGIAPDHIFSSRDKSFAADILAATSGKGVDVVLNTLSGALLQETFNCVARFGRFVEIGRKDLENHSQLDMGAFTLQVSFTSLDLVQLELHKGGQINRVMKDIVRLFGENSIAAADPITTYSLSDVEKTFRILQSGKQMGKVVLSVKPDDLVPVRL